jgi:CheY-like chemotaxis protein
MSPKILVIDDEPTLLNVITRLFQKLKFEVVTAPDGQKAIDLYRENPTSFDFVIIDYMLKGLSSRETLLSLKELNPNFRGVITTGYSADEKLDELRNLGVVAGLQKPFLLPELQALIKKMGY